MLQQQRDDKMIILCAAGTGGHLFPAQHLAEELKGQYRILFAGKSLSSNPYFHEKQFNFTEINAATFSLRRPLTLVKASFAIGQGLWQSMRLLRKQKPSLLIGFGSFFSLPLLLAAKMLRVPFVLHEQNLLPGRVNRLFAAHSLCMATTFSETKKYVKGCVTQVQFPQKNQEKEIDKSSVAAYFGLRADRKTILIFGGSQGAKFINELAKELVLYLPKEEWQLLHFVGRDADLSLYRNYYQQQQIPAAVKLFEKEMHKAYALADLVVSRAGAATVNELLKAKLPAFLIPFPYATDDHQTKNGQFFAHDVGAGWLFAQNEVKAADLAAKILTCNEEMLLAKKQRMQEYIDKEQKELLSFATLIRHMCE